MQYSAGIDIGSSAVKAVIIIDRDYKIIGKGLHKSGSDLKEASAKALNEALQEAKLKESDIARFAATGFGRSSCPFPNKTITEISAHARGVYYYFPRAATVIDIGGQDNKMIRLDASGHILNFRMNRKCAAGTGAFLEEIAYKMDIPLPELNRLAKLSTKPIELGSYCTVFTATEILSKIREGIKKEDIVCGVFRSIIKRIIEMDPLTDDVILTGGVIAHNDIIKELLSKTLNKDILVPADPQFTGALGAALFGATDKH
ncbi:MAG: acyl-CoA dehydratase activase [Planctomycetota bacterium]